MRIPYISRVDAGTIELVRDLGVDVVSSGDLVQRFEAVWKRIAIATHRAASDELYASRIRRSMLARRRLRAVATPTEFDIQQLMAGWFQTRRGLLHGCGPQRVGAGERRQSALPPTPEAHRRSAPRRCCCSTSGASCGDPGAVFADITWMGFTGPAVPERFARAFATVATARRRGHAGRAGCPRRPRTARLGGRSRAASSVEAQAGYGDRVPPPHRPQPRRIGARQRRPHGRLRNHDDRRLLPGTGFTIEPGVYFKDFGVRTEINMFVGARRRVGHRADPVRNPHCMA